MSPIHAPRRAVVAGALASLMVAAALPVHAVNIPEGGAVTPGSSFLFNVRVTSTCDGLPMDELEVTIPESVTNPTPVVVPGWDVSIETPEEIDDESAGAGAEGDDAEVPPTVVRWSNGLLEDGFLIDFGIRARFPDEEGAVLEFPVVQRCGDVEVESVPTVNLNLRYGQAEIAALSDEVAGLSAEMDVLRADVDQLQQQVGDVNVEFLRGRVGDTEKAIVELDERVTALEEGEPVPASEG